MNQEEAENHVRHYIGGNYGMVRQERIKDELYEESRLSNERGRDEQDIEPP
jgi:hypothetical protein